MTKQKPRTIKELRLLAGLTQSQAAQLINRNLRMWQYYESGRIKIDDALKELFIIKISNLLAKSGKEK